MGARIWPEYGAHEYGAAYCRGSISPSILGPWILRQYLVPQICAAYRETPIFASYFFYCFHLLFPSIFHIDICKTAAIYNEERRKEETARGEHCNTSRGWIAGGTAWKRLWQQHALANMALAASLHLSRRPSFITQIR